MSAAKYPLPATRLIWKGTALKWRIRDVPWDIEKFSCGCVVARCVCFDGRCSGSRTTENGGGRAGRGLAVGGEDFNARWRETERHSVQRARAKRAGASDFHVHAVH